MRIEHFEVTVPLEDGTEAVGTTDFEVSDEKLAELQAKVRRFYPNAVVRKGEDNGAYVEFSND